MVRTTLASIKNPESWNLEKAKKKSTNGRVDNFHKCDGLEQTWLKENRRKHKDPKPN